MDEAERERRVEVYAGLFLADPRRSIFGWAASPPPRGWAGVGRLTLWRPERAMRA